MPMVPSIAAAGATVLLLAACAAPPSLSNGDVQDVIASELAEQVGGSFTVTCPSAVPAEPGQRFTCDVTDEGTRDTVSVQVAVTDAEGAFTWQVVPTPRASASPQGSAAGG